MQQGFSQLHDGALAWHSAGRASSGDLQLKEFDTFGRKVGYATSKTGQETLFNWLRQNPHGLHLGAWARLEKGRWHRRDPDDLKNARNDWTSGAAWWKACLNLKVSRSR